jgi:hypothetical protein
MQENGSPAFVSADSGAPDPPAGAALRDGSGGYLRPKLKDLADPFLIPDMRPAVERILEAVDRRKSICILAITMWMAWPRSP